MPAAASARSRAPMSVPGSCHGPACEQRCGPGEQRLVVLAERDEVALVDRKVPPGRLDRLDRLPPLPAARQLVHPVGALRLVDGVVGGGQRGAGGGDRPRACRVLAVVEHGAEGQQHLPRTLPAPASRVARHPGGEHAVPEFGGDGAAPGAVRGDQHGDVGREAGREAGRLRSRTRLPFQLASSPRSSARTMRRTPRPRPSASAAPRAACGRSGRCRRRCSPGQAPARPASPGPRR